MVGAEARNPGTGGLVVCWKRGDTRQSPLCALVARAGCKTFTKVTLWDIGFGLCRIVSNLGTLDTRAARRSCTCAFHLK